MTDIDADLPIQRTAFLDTTDLVSLYMFWDACESASTPMDTISNWSSLKSALEAAGVATSALSRPSDNVSRGINLFVRLLEGSKRYQYCTSRVCWSEAHHTLLESLGLESLIRNGVPLSLREKRSQLVYQASLTRADHNQIADRLQSFRETVQLDYSMDIIEIEASAIGLGVTSADIWNGAQAIWSSVLMPVVDAYVCAAAILAKVDVFISGDPGRRSVLKRLRDSSQDGPDKELVRESLGLGQFDMLPDAMTSSAALP